jgi:hypothetical protein
LKTKARPCVLRRTRGQYVAHFGYYYFSVGCREVHSRAREMVRQGYMTALVATTLANSRSSLCYRKKPGGSRADRSCDEQDEQIVVAFGEKLAYGYRQVAWWLWRRKVCERIASVCCVNPGCWCSRGVCAPDARKSGPRGNQRVDQIWQSDITKIWAGPAVCSAYLGSVIDCCTREIVGKSLTSLPDRRCVGNGGTCGKPDDNHRQRNTVLFFAIPGSARTPRHHASADGVPLSALHPFRP